MRLETFRGRDLAMVCAHARSTFGDDVVIVSTRTTEVGTRPWIEVEATAAEDIAALQELVSPEPAPPRAGFARALTRARVIALVGPTGAGKTTTLAKLAVHPDAFGASRVGFLTFDTHRAAAYEQLAAYAEAAGLPCEMVYDSAELAPAIKRLGECDVILVDTPGRGPRADLASPAWRALLKELRADETHLVLPATMRFDLVPAICAEYQPLGVTHALLTKLDEVPRDSRIAGGVATVGLPMRWVTDGQHVPDDLRAAAVGVLGTLGMAPAAMAPAMEAA